MGSPLFVLQSVRKIGRHMRFSRPSRLRSDHQDIRATRRLSRIRS